MIRYVESLDSFIQIALLNSLNNLDLGFIDPFWTAKKNVLDRQSKFLRNSQEQYGDCDVFGSVVVVVIAVFRVTVVAVVVVPVLRVVVDGSFLHLKSASAP